MSARNSAVVVDDRALVITRIFDAPPRLVFKAWSSCEHLSRWMGPEGFKITSCEMDFRVGGKLRSCMRSPPGTDHWLSGVFMEIVEPTRTVSTSAWENPPGTRGHETLLTLTFEPEGRGKTRFTLHQSAFESVESRDGHQGGWSQALDKLGAYVAQASKSGVLK
jgi:uncharacterized protein YndB with AHSA1/START domain